MAKYSVSGTEIIDDNGKIDWTRIKNKPDIHGPQSLYTTYGNCSGQGYIVSSINTATGYVTMTLSAGGGAGYACDCQCQCQCQCVCACDCRGA